MKKYAKPAVEIEKFTVADVITESTPKEEDTTITGGNDFGELSVGIEINDEF